MRTLAILLALLLPFAAAPAAAQGNDNNAGTVKVHDDETENPPRRNVPHVSCDFWIEGFGMNDPSGTLLFLSWPPTGNKEVVTPTGASLSWNGTEDGMGNFGFLAGPFQLGPGHYRVEVYTDDGHPGTEDRFAKAKTFWVEPCGVPPVNPSCPPQLVAVALDEGGVRLSFGAVVGATSYNVYRALGEEDFEFLANVNATEYVDVDVEVGVTYSYYVTAVLGDSESVECAQASVTTIPFFGGPLLIALATAGAVAAYVALRRRS